MSDSSKINIKNDFVKPGLAKADSASTQSSSKSSNPKTNSDIYKASTNSQNKLIVEKDTKLQKTGQGNIVNKENISKPNVEIRHKNPILHEQLKKIDAKLGETNKIKQPPPEPSLRVKLSPKGYPINPRKVKPSIPGRLNPSFDNGISPLDRLALSLGEQISVNLNNLYADNLLKDYMSNYHSSSIAELLNLEYTIFNQDTSFVIDFLSARAELLAEDQFLYDFLQNVLNILQQTQNPIQQILQLYLPFPLPFIVKDLDLEFEADENELKEDSTEGDNKKEQNPEDGEEAAEDEHDEISLSVTTLNFNKMHFLIKFLKSSNDAKVYIKGDTSSSELSIPIEMGIDDILYADVNHLDFHNSLWRKQIPLGIHERSLKIKHKGKLDARMISVTRAILETIADNDCNEEINSEMI
jgi:hypothetical protein